MAKEISGKKDSLPKDKNIEMEKLAEEHANNFLPFSNIEGIIIRGHILIEQALNRTIQLTVINGDEYKPEKFSFAQKIVMAAMLGISEDFTQEITALNKLRNQIAHSLKFDEKHIDIIICGIIKKYPKVADEEKIDARLMTCISFICGAISNSHKRARTKAAIHGLKTLE